MLHEQSRLFQRLLFFADAVLIALAWVLAYLIRFAVLTPPEWLPFSRYAWLLPWVVLLTTLLFWASGLYAPDRAQRLTRLVYSVAKAVLLGLVGVTASLSFYRELSFSRLHMLLFGVLTPTFMVLLRLGLYFFVRRARQRGKHVRRVLIVGAGKAGRRLAQSFAQYPWIGLEVIGFLDDHPADATDVLGTTDQTLALVDRMEAEGRKVDYVYIALPLSAVRRIEGVVAGLATRTPHVCLVPDIFQFDILNSRVTDIDGVPVIHLIDEAPLEFRQLLKRGLDIAFSLGVLLLASPLMLLIALGVKLSSAGPVFYRQERMGLNGETFHMLKFRSMPVNAEASTGAVWAQKNETRATPLGAFLRRTSLDELPQFINVLKGEMSVVGPRPERPVFIQAFKEQIPGYMLRHKVKAGITGWAQVNGWRGNTSIEKRIEYDLYYIQNWSLLLDLKIMAMTLWKGFVHENAY
ncbi:MAG: undecaprenyl-phosphate glucose phosphotransferase [Bacteroidota bacterium]